MTHRKRLSAPKQFPIERKHNTYVKDAEGSRSIEDSIPATVFLRDVLEVVETQAEATKVIKSGGLERNGKEIRDSAQGIGVLDTVKVNATGETFRVIRNGENLEFIEVSDSENQIARIKGKRAASSGFVYELHNGENFSSEEEYQTGSSLEFIGDKVNEVPLEEGSQVIITDGKHAGETGELEEIEDRGMSGRTATVTAEDEFRTRLENVTAYNQVEVKMEDE